MTPSNMVLCPSEGEHELGVVNFDLSYAVGATGALTATYAKGVVSATRNAAGDYSFVLDAAYVAFLSGKPEVRGVYATTTGTRGWVTSVGTDSTTGHTVIRVGFYPDAESTTLTEIASGNVLSFHFRMKAIA